MRMAFAIYSFIVVGLFAVHPGLADAQEYTSSGNGAAVEGVSPRLGGEGAAQPRPVPIVC